MPQLTRERRKGTKNSKKIGIVKEVGPSPMIPINTRVTQPIYEGLSRYKDDYGLSSEQDVVRLAIARFLKQESYI